MIGKVLTPNGVQEWSNVPVTTDKEVSADQAVLKFSATTSIAEKVQRVFNGMMFFIAGASLLNLIPAVNAAILSLSGMGFAAISGVSLFQIPAAAAIMALAPKIIVTLAVIQVIRKVLAVAINHFIYPAVLMSYDKRALDKERLNAFQDLRGDQFECRRVALNKSGINYDAFAFEHEDTKENGQWVIVAGGNRWIGESAAPSVARKFKELGFNVLYVNGPGVGRSSGYPTSYSIGSGQEAGLQFLEKVADAKKILLYGTSLGGGAQSEAIKNHTFNTKDIDYLVWSDRSFDKLSNAASSMVTALAKPIFFLLGIELDGVAGAKKLKKLGITHIVTQNSQMRVGNGPLPLTPNINSPGVTDGVIPNKASLYVGLMQAGIHDPTRLKCYGGPRVLHNGNLHQDINDLVENDIQAFLTKSKIV